MKSSRPIFSIAAGAAAAAALFALAPPTHAGDGDAAAANGCGVERWKIKTLNDPGAFSVSLTPRDTTVAALRGYRRPHTLSSSRLGSVEKTTYRVHAQLVEFKLEEDSDVHLDVADPRSGGTMIVEVPALHCVAQPSAAVRKKIGDARSALIRACGRPSASHFTEIHGSATISGVGFWDFKHHQAGVAPNAIELHPVIRFSGRCG